MAAAQAAESGAPKTKADDLSAPEGEPAARHDFPCSPAQERFWLLDRLDPGNSAYNVAVRWRLEGRIATDLLERAWLCIIERHEVLRTLFLEIDGVPIQRVMPNARFRLTEIDLSNLSAELQHTEGNRIGIIEARAPFDLATGPLIRATLLRFSPSVAIILVTCHQIVSDGWSIGIMAREMGVIYDALRRDQPIELEPLAIQYADYSEWQLEWLKARGTEAETAYWSKQLAGIQPFKVLPDHARPAMPTTNGAIASRLLPRHLTNTAQGASAEHGVTLFAICLAALCATLARLTNQTEIVVGTQVSGRDQVELEPMIGQFVNSLILRSDLSGDPTFGAIVDRVRDTVAQALDNRHIPIERLLGMVQSERSHAESAPISVNFIFQKTFIHNTSYADFALIDMPSLPAGAIYDLNLFMVERPDGWRFSCQYNTDQFEEATAVRLLAYFERLLGSAVGDMSLRLSELTLSPPEEARAAFAKLNDTRTLYPRELAIGQLFDAQVALAPDAVAVICADRQMTYAEMAAAANRFAAYLQHQGVARDSRVGVCIPASMGLPVCLLSILKMGATYVMLDPDDPPRRRLEMLRTSGATAVVGNTAQLAALTDVPVRLIDAEAALAHDVELSRAAAANAPQPSDRIACVVFAAAGDDESRMVRLSHRQLTNLIYSLAKRPGVGNRDVVVAISPPATAQAALEIFLPLLTGAQLVLAVEKDIANGRALLQLLQRTAATVLYGDLHDWGALLDAKWIGYPALKMLCAATELSARMSERLSATGGELWSLYGHPEAGIWSAVHLVKPHESPGNLGEPMANTVLYVLEPSRRIAPMGVVGEVYIGGEGLGESALARAVVSESGAKLYPTGDFGRLRTGGDIEYLGRADQRFWHRGRSIVPADIERLLLEHPAVAAAAVIALDDGRAGDGGSAFKDGIGAFVVSRSAEPPDADTLIPELHKLLAERLPAYLLPTSIDVLRTLPHLQNGAIDARALRTMQARGARGAESPRPSGDIEVRLAAIWSSLLGVESITADDNFFELGGHSLLAARMLAQVEHEFGRRIKLATLFLAPTLRDLAKVLAQSDLRDFDFRQVVKIQPHGSKRPLIVINNTGVYYGLAKNLGAEQPVVSLQLFDPSVRDPTLPASLEEVAAGYVELIRRVQSRGPYDLMGWCVAGALTFEIARQLVADGQAVSHLFLIDSWVPGYFKRMPKLRGMLGSYSLRGQLIRADWRRVTASKTSVWKFLAQRTLFKKLQGFFMRARQGIDAAGDSPRITAATYDLWLLAYLQRLTAQFEPKPYSGAVTLLRSRLEPTGWFFQKDAGWGAFTPLGIDVQFVDGDHFTMFQEPGSSQMAKHVAAILERTASSQN